MDENGGRLPKESVIQDVEGPVESGAEFLEFFAREVKMSPVWMCPLRLRGQLSPGGATPRSIRTPRGLPDGSASRAAPPNPQATVSGGQRTWPLYPLKPREVYLDFGFWGMARLPAGHADGY